MSERARFRVNALSFIGHGLCQPGSEVFYTPSEGGGVSENLSPLNDTAQDLIDAQTRDHPDKTIHRAKKARAAAKAEAAEAEVIAETTNGPLPKGVKAKGDTRKDKPLAEKPEKPAKPAKEPAADAPLAKDDEKDDVA